MATSSEGGERIVGEPKAKELQRHLVVKEGIAKRGELCSCMRSNDVVLLRNCDRVHLIVEQNQRLAGILVVACKSSRISVLDSAVVTSGSIRLADCNEVELVIEDVRIARVDLWRCERCKVVLVGDDVLVEGVHIITHEGCSGNSVEYSKLRRSPLSFSIGLSPVRNSPIPDSGAAVQWLTRLEKPPCAESRVFIGDDGKLTSFGAEALRRTAVFTKPTALPRDSQQLCDPTATVPKAEEFLASISELEGVPYNVTDSQVDEAYDEERREWEEPDDTLLAKVKRIAEQLRSARHCVVFTGAGISTSAEIPDFRGPKGVWTLRDKGKEREAMAGGKDFHEARPTLAHYAITELVKRGFVKFVVTTNMDGLHARTGIPLHLLEELHGSCYTEVCSGCGTRYRRAEDVARGSPDHITGNNCDWCGKPLLDTIVNFSDTYRSELEPVVVGWHSKEADLAIVLGTSMCVQPAASYPQKVLDTEEPQPHPSGDKGKGKAAGKAEEKAPLGLSPHSLVIVNLQETPADNVATVRAWAKTDRFCALLMSELGITDFDTGFDAKPLWAAEEQLRKKYSAANAKNEQDGKSKWFSWIWKS